jgi:hypothetical protein
MRATINFEGFAGVFEVPVVRNPVIMLVGASDPLKNVSGSPVENKRKSVRQF